MNPSPSTLVEITPGKATKPDTWMITTIAILVPSVSSCIKSPKEPQSTANVQPDAICSSVQGDNPGNSEEVPLTLAQDDTIQNKHVIDELPNGSVSILDQLRKTPISSTGSLRKRSRDALSQKVDVQNRAPSLRSSRSSSKMDLCNIQNSEVQLKAECCENDSGPAVLLEECLLNSKVIGNSPVIHEAESEVSTLIPNNSNEDAGSGTVAVELGSHSLNEGSTELNCKAESRVEHLDKSLVSNGGPVIQRKMVVLKKKRKPNKKRVDQEMTTHAKLEKESCVQDERDKNILILSESCQNTDEKHNKTGGDEHLPLVKRARVRMGSMPEEKKLDDLGTAEKSEKVALVNHEVNVSDETLLNTRKTFSVSSPSNDHIQTKDQDNMPRRGNMYPLRGSTMDVEAALPPSKRLHRALEAMSANAAEAGNNCMENPNFQHMRFTDYPVSKSGSCHSLSDGDRNGPRDSNELSNSISGMPSSLTSQVPNTPTECHPHVNVTHCDISHGNSTSLHSMDCEGKLVDVNESKDLCSKEVKTELDDGHCSVEVRDEKIIAVCGHSSLDPSPSSAIDENNKQILPLNKESPLDAMREDDSNSQAVKLETDSDSKPVPEKVDCAVNAEVGGDFLPQDATGTTHPITDGAAAIHLSVCVKSSSSLSDEKCGDNTQEVTMGVKHKSTPKGSGFSPDSTPMKVLIAAAQAKRFFSRSGSLSENGNCKLVPDYVSRAPLVHKSGNKSSPPNSVVNCTPTLDEETSSLQSSSRSPDATMHLKNSVHLIDGEEVRLDSVTVHKQKSLNKTMGHAEVTAARKSFEILLSSLSRTKESIGRATRVAIDCAKYGIAGEVLLEMLTRLWFSQCFHVYCLQLLPLAMLLGIIGSNVLRLWLERKTLPESIVRHHIRELESVNEASFSSGSSRRPPRSERPLNDPVREMEGMLVDEYGSNASFHIPGFLGSRMLDDEEESIDDEKGFQTVTPEHDAETCKEADAPVSCIPEKHTHILEDVDGELEMEDVSPPREAERSSPYDTAGVSSEHAPSCHFDKHGSLPFPPLPAENPPSPPPLPSSPPPVAPSCPSVSSFVSPHPTRISQNHADGLDSHSYMDRNNMQYPSSGHQSGASSLSVVPSDRVDCFASGYVDHPKQMQLPAASLKSSSPYGYLSGCHPSVHGANDTPPIGSGPIHSNGYHMQPPPPAITNQFPHAPSDKQHVQTWGDSSPFDRNGAFAAEAQGRHFYGDRHTRGPAQHEISERCRFSATVHSGPMLPEKVEASPNLRAYYAPPAETSSVPNRGWGVPPRTSTYHYSLAASRPPLENQVSRVAGGVVFNRIPWLAQTFQKIFLRSLYLLEIEIITGDLNAIRHCTYVFYCLSAKAEEQMVLGRAVL
ncbi:hypothetical protein Taro_022453 [Colocasia esculenta]|uniref:Uncharacterized protein n=1 Tax=Colocasia esculenta TaxID=4460 RepID=A0A843VEH8_COLES|nr:hypothetical protein [Colocasia esculenta]